MQTEIKEQRAPKRSVQKNVQFTAVRRVLRRFDTQSYFASDGWTSNPEEALAFADSLEAAQAAIEYGLSGVEVVLRLSGASTDLFCTPLR